jgi:hypothetical protein
VKPPLLLGDVGLRKLLEKGKAEMRAKAGGAMRKTQGRDIFNHPLFLPEIISLRIRRYLFVVLNLKARKDK